MAPLTGGYGLGTHSNYNGGLSLNHPGQPYQLVGNYNYSNNTNTTRRISIENSWIPCLTSHSKIKNANETHTFKTGLDYFLNKNNTLGIMVDGSLSNYTTKTQSSTPISYIPDGNVGKGPSSQ